MSKLFILDNFKERVYTSDSLEEIHVFSRVSLEMEKRQAKDRERLSHLRYLNLKIN